MQRFAVSPSIEAAERERLTPQFHVVLLDDDEHTYPYVIEMLESLFVLSRAQAFRHALEVDSTGRTVVLTCERPAAEYARDQIRAYGPDPRFEGSRGSMSAILVPAGNQPPGSS